MVGGSVTQHRGLISYHRRSDAGCEVSTTHRRGRELEQLLGGFLTRHGYQVRYNVVIEGRSGARHELDVVGDKSDGLTSFRLVVECKAWNAAIDKDVVYKLAGVLADLGAAKGIIAALSGWTVQAAQVAAQANIELWGPDELTARLGQATVSDLRFTSSPVQALGVLFVAAGEPARRLVERSARGTLGVGREEIVWFGLIWLPVWILQLGITRLEGFRRVSRVTRSWNRYEALTGRHLGSSHEPPQLVPIDLGTSHLRPILSDAKIRETLIASVERWRSVSSEEAKKRHAANLAKAGLQVPFRHVAAEGSQPAYEPLWSAFLTKGGKERIVAIDGVTGRERPDLGHALTTRVQWVRESLAPA